MHAKKIAFLAVGLLSLPAHAHILLTSPESRYGDDSAKINPCGLGVPADHRTANVTTYSPGETITVVWTETIDHTGHFRISFDPDGGDAADFDNPANILIDNIADPGGTGGRVWSQQVTLPNIECNNCTLQLTQDMGGSIYHQCADLILRTPGPVDAGFPDAAPDAGFPDARPIDTGVVDTGVVDTGVVDTGVMDTGGVDAGVADSGGHLHDAEPLDTGRIDTGVGDAGVATDTGAPDALTGDASVSDATPGEEDASTEDEGGLVAGEHPISSCASSGAPSEWMILGLALANLRLRKRSRRV